MRIHMNLQWLTILVLGVALISAADNFENKHPRAWAIPGETDSDILRTIDENVSSSSVKIEPSSYSEPYVPKIPRISKVAHEFKDYVFRPRSKPLNNLPSQEQGSIYYSHKVGEKTKSEYLFPGNYIPISEVKRKENATDDTTYNPLSAGTFKPLTIPLMRDQEAMKRSLNEGEEIVTEKSSELTSDSVSRRSISYIFGADDDEDDDGGESEYETDEEDDTLESKGGGSKGGKKKNKRRKIKVQKYSKYMMPLLLAYKLKFFSLAPVMISGLVLLVGATGLAGFFFALFAAVMGLQKGGDY